MHQVYMWPEQQTVLLEHRVIQLEEKPKPLPQQLKKMNKKEWIIKRHHINIVLLGSSEKNTNSNSFLSLSLSPSVVNNYNVFTTVQYCTHGPNKAHNWTAWVSKNRLLAQRLDRRKKDTLPLWCCRLATENEIITTTS